MLKVVLNVYSINNVRNHTLFVLMHDDHRTANRNMTQYRMREPALYLAVVYPVVINSWFVVVDNRYLVLL
jgi:uncharacterized membrane protein YsdA (DUF1294 family)